MSGGECGSGDVCGCECGGGGVGVGRGGCRETVCPYDGTIASHTHSRFPYGHLIFTCTSA